METVREYNRAHAGKAWAIVAMTTENGSAFCADCVGGWATDDHSPVFASDDADGIVCDVCLSAVTA